MQGEEGNPGILPQAAADIFEGVGERVALNLKMSVLELYQDSLVDLLAEPGAGCKLNIRQDEKARLPAPSLCVHASTVAATESHSYAFFGRSLLLDVLVWCV